MTLTRKWSLLAAVLAVAILAAGWFLLISPKRSDAAEIQSQAATQEQANARLVQQIEELKAQQADLPEQQAKLATLQTQIPDNPALPSLIRNLTEAGGKAGVTIESMEPQPPLPIVAPAAAPVVASTTSTESDGTATSGDSASTDTAPAPVAAKPSLYQVPLTLTVSGTYFELEQFVHKLEGLQRSFRVVAFGLDTSADADAPAGSLSMTLQGQVYLSPAPAATATQPTPVASASAE